MSKYIIRDWTSAINVPNEIYSAWKINVTVYRSHDNDIDGYSLEVYDKTKLGRCYNGIIYKFDIDTTIKGHCSYSTNEAIEFLNNIGFNIEFDYSVYEITDEVKDQLTHLSELGYKTLVRIVRPWCKVYLSTEPESDIARRLTYADIRDVLPFFDNNVSNILKYRDYLFLLPNTPTPISEILRNTEA